MKTLKYLSYILLMLALSFPLKSQQNTVVPQRTPEQEATRQTERLQKELNLSTEQTRQVYEINLKYARQRQISNTRSEAIERMKNKSTDIQRVLNPQQNERLQSKWVERTSVNPVAGSRQSTTMPSSSPAFRTAPEFRANTGSRQSSSEDARRGSSRTQVTTEPGSRQVPQTVHRGNQETTRPSVSAPSTRSYSQPQTSQPARQSSTSSGSTPTRSESTQGSRR